MTLVDGTTYYFAIETKDYAGNTSCSSKLTYNYDITVPTLSASFYNTSLTEVQGMVKQMAFDITNTTDSDIVSTKLLVSHNGDGSTDCSDDAEYTDASRYINFDIVEGAVLVVRDPGIQLIVNV